MAGTNLETLDEYVDTRHAWKLIKPKQRKFIDGYLRTGTVVGGEANAGWSAGMGHKHLKNPVVRAALISRRRDMEKLGMIETSQVLAELKEIAFADLGTAVPTFDHKLRALEMLGKNQKLFTERMEVTGNLTLSALVKASIQPNAAPLELPAEYAVDVPQLPAPAK